MTTGKQSIVPVERIEKRIFLLRGQKVMLSTDLAEMYQVEPRLIKEAGLYRERTRAGDVWRWKKPPRGDWVMSWEKIGNP